MGKDAANWIKDSEGVGWLTSQVEPAAELQKKRKEIKKEKHVENPPKKRNGFPNNLIID